MISQLANLVKNNKTLILGFGKEGQSTYQTIRSIFPNKTLSIADQNSNHQKAIELEKEDQNIIFKLGEDYLDRIENYDLIFKSPGINLKDIKLKPNTVLSSQTQLFLQSYSSQTIGITGTKGKSTTASLIHYILTQAGKNSVLIGNIGIPPFSSIKNINAETIIVFELSAHQLENSEISPHISILLNIFQEHLDYFQSFEKYSQSKYNIFANQNEGDLLILNSDQDELRSIMLKTPLQKIKSFSLNKSINTHCYKDKGVIYLNADQTPTPMIKTAEILNIIGTHNQYNIMAAIIACSAKGLSPKQIKSGIEGFKSLEHRLEYVGKYAGINFYNDSISTIPEATIEAVKSLPETDTLILGGFDRGIDYDGLIDFLISSKINNFIFMGPAGSRMKTIFESKQHPDKFLFCASSFKEVFQQVTKVTTAGKTCLLSPAAASYDLFKNFEERGLMYKKTARNL